MAKVLTGIGFAGLASVNSWVFGGCLVYNFLGLSVGQSALDSQLRRLLGAYAIGSAVIVGMENCFM